MLINPLVKINQLAEFSLPSDCRVARLIYIWDGGYNQELDNNSYHNYFSHFSDYKHTARQHLLHEGILVHLAVPAIGGVDGSGNCDTIPMFLGELGLGLIGDGSTAYKSTGSGFSWGFYYYRGATISLGELYSRKGRLTIPAFEIVGESGGHLESTINSFLNGLANTPVSTRINANQEFGKKTNYLVAASKGE